MFKYIFQTCVTAEPTIFNDAYEDMSDDPSVRKRLRGLGKTRWREEQTTTESSR